MEHFLQLKRKLALTISAAVAIALLIAVTLNYHMSKTSIIDALINKELPLTASAVIADLRDERLGLFLNATPSNHHKSYLSHIDYGLDRVKLNQMLDLYHQEYGHNIYLVNKDMRIISSNQQSLANKLNNLRDIDAFEVFSKTLNKKNLSEKIQYQGNTILVNVHYLPNLDWYLLVDTNATKATASLRQALYANLVVYLFALMAIFGLTHLAMHRYQRQNTQPLGDISSTDTLTGLANRNTFDILIGHILENAKRTQIPTNLLLVKIDLTKSDLLEDSTVITDNILAQAGKIIKKSIRTSDVGCRWSEDTFLIILNNCQPKKATSIAKNLTLKIQLALINHNIVTDNQKPDIRIGVTNYHINDSLDTLIERTERALIHAKSKTHPNVVYTPYYAATPLNTAQQATQN